MASDLLALETNPWIPFWAEWLVISNCISGKCQRCRSCNLNFCIAHGFSTFSFTVAFMADQMPSLSWNIYKSGCRKLYSSYISLSVWVSFVKIHMSTYVL